MRLGGIVERAAHPAPGPLNGGPQMVEVSRDGRRVYPHQLALRGLGRAVLPRGDRRLAGQARRGRGRLARARPRRVRRVQRRAPAPGPPPGRRRLLRLLLLPGSLMDELWPWVLMALLGAYHGLNPAMGWLFAVALGMQERDRRAVLRALPPIAIGHEASVVLAAALVLGLGLLADTSALHMGAGDRADRCSALFRFVKPRAHFRWVKARVTRARAGVVVVPDVDRARRRADGRAGAARRERGGRGRGAGPRARRRSRSTGSRCRGAASRCCCTSARWSR